MPETRIYLDSLKRTGLTTLYAKEFGTVTSPHSTGTISPTELGAGYYTFANLDETKAYTVQETETEGVRAATDEWLVVLGVKSATLSNQLDQFETITAKLDAVRGPGDRDISIQVLNSSGVPIPNVQCWVSTDIAGESVITDPAFTNSQGIVRFLLNAGSYFLFRQKAGLSFVNPKSFSVLDPE